MVNPSKYIDVYTYYFNIQVFADAGEFMSRNYHVVSPRLCKCPFLRLVGGRGGGGGGGGMRQDNSVVGERAGGAGGGASRPAPVTMDNENTGVKEV